MTLTPTRIRGLLDAHGIRPRKALGQHFLADPNTATRIVGLAELRAGARVIEVGPGVGSLTVALLDAGVHVLAVELDAQVLPILEAVTADRDIEIVSADARTVDWPALLGGAPEPWSMVANLPYNVATAIAVEALERAPMIERLLVMVQREVGERLAAGPGEKSYGAVSVKVAYYADAKVVGRVPPTVFLPQPKVDSVLVRLDRRPVPIVDDVERMFALVRAGFATRRKTLRNALAGMVDADAFARAGIDPSARAETLGVRDWARLSDAS